MSENMCLECNGARLKEVLAVTGRIFMKLAVCL